MQSLLTFGLDVTPIQIIHYASVHYTSQHKQYWKRFLNAYLEIGETLTSHQWPGNNSMILNSVGNSERMADTSEIIASGLSTMLMCKWFDVAANRIVEIPNMGARKRCDFELISEGKRIIYESKGRSHQKNLSTAVSDGKSKKLNCTASEAYVIACFLPRNGQATNISIYDPESESLDLPQDYTLYIILNYYKNCAWLSGLSLLAHALDERIKEYYSTGKLSRQPLRLSEKVTKVAEEITIQNQQFIRGKFGMSPFSYEDAALCSELEFSLSKDVVKMLSDMDLASLLSFSSTPYTSPASNVNMIETGSFLHLNVDNRVTVYL